MASLVLSFMGRDKPGLVGLLSKTIADHQGNWQESAMSRLGGQFAGILIIQAPVSEHEALIAALEQLEQQGLKIHVKPSTDTETGPTGRAVTLDLIGHDKAGIVRDISRTLAGLQVNVHRMQTELTSGSMSGEQLFKAHAEILVPATVDLDHLQETLEAIASDLMVDITLN